MAFRSTVLVYWCHNAELVKTMWPDFARFPITTEEELAKLFQELEGNHEIRTLCLDGPVETDEQREMLNRLYRWREGRDEFKSGLSDKALEGIYWRTEIEIVCGGGEARLPTPDPAQVRERAATRDDLWFGE